MFKRQIFLPHAQGESGKTIFINMNTTYTYYSYYKNILYL